MKFIKLILFFFQRFSTSHYTKIIEEAKRLEGHTDERHFECEIVLRLLWKRSHIHYSRPHVSRSAILLGRHNAGMRLHPGRKLPIFPTGGA